MPAGDRTGPSGLGPGTGRAFGYCFGFDTPGFTRGQGRGAGRGMGRGFNYGGGRVRGRGVMGAPGYFSPSPGTPAMSKDEEVKLLKSQADALTRSQKEIEKRLGELEKEQ